MRQDESAVITSIEGIPFYTFPALDRTGIVKAAFSTRLGGVSSGIFSSMNLNFDRGDDPENVMQNFRLAAHALGSSVEEMVRSDQTHTSNVRIMTSADAGKGFVKERDYQDIDGMITDVPGLMLVTSHADCVPLFFADPIRRVIALSHSGWKGTESRIGQITVQKMQDTYGSNPSDIVSVIGPSICQDCYEIGEDVASVFKDSFHPSQWDYILLPKGNGKYQLDLWEANRMILTEAGLKPENIIVSGICTSCHSDLLWSHRKTKGQRGGLCAFLCLMPEDNDCE